MHLFTFTNLTPFPNKFLQSLQWLEHKTSINPAGTFYFSALFYTLCKLIYTFWASLMAQLVKNLPAVWETWVWSCIGKNCWRRERLPTPTFWPGEFHGLCSPWGHKKLDMTEQLSLTYLLTFQSCNAQCAHIYLDPAFTVNIFYLHEFFEKLSLD